MNSTQRFSPTPQTHFEGKYYLFARKIEKKWNYLATLPIVGIISSVSRITVGASLVIASVATLIFANIVNCRCSKEIDRLKWSKLAADASGETIAGLYHIARGCAELALAVSTFSVVTFFVYHSDKTLFLKDVGVDLSYKFADEYMNRDYPVATKFSPQAESL